MGRCLTLSYSLRIIVLALLFMVPTCPLLAAAEKDAALHKSAVELMDVGSALYNRGMYAAAQQSLVKADENKQYLSDAEQKKLADLLGKTKDAVEQRNQILEQIKASDALSKQNNYAGAASRLEAIKDSKYLTKAERNQVLTDLKKLQANVKDNEAAMTALYAQSVKEFDAGNKQAARKGFETVAASGVAVSGMSAKEYLAKIEPAPADAQIAQNTNTNNEEDLLKETQPAQTTETVAKVEVLPAQTAQAQPSQAVEKVADVTQASAPVAAAQPAEAATGGYIDRVLQQRNIQKSYTEAVVQDAINKAKAAVAEGNFDAATGYVAGANRVVENNRMLLGDDAYKSFSSLSNAPVINNKDMILKRQLRPRLRRPKRSSRPLWFSRSFVPNRNWNVSSE